jgi:AbrB family looped-hinge helix DNA binding protein
MTNKSTIGPKGQITIPKELRERYHMHEGEEVILLPGEEGVLIKHPQPTLRGSLRGKIDMKGFERDLREIRKQWKL